MKTPQLLKTNPFSRILQKAALPLAAVLVLAAATHVQAASQTWTNAPVDANFANTNNWVGKAVPGATNSSTTADVATFISPIAGGIGGAGNPITNDLQRGVRSIVFDTADVGAYVFGHDTNDNYIEINNGTTNLPSGNITMTSLATNPVAFNIPLRTRLPSSQNLTYAITNNAVPASATFYFAAFTNTSAATRPFVLTLDGSNSGTNTIARFDDQTAAAAQAGAIVITKQGSGRWILSGSNDLPQKTSAGVIAAVTVNEGLLVVKDPYSLGAITVNNLVVQSNGTMQFDNISPSNTGFTLRNGGVLRMNGSGALNGLTIGNAASTVGTVTTTSPSDVLTLGTAAAKVIGGAADTVTHLAGPGTIVLPFSSTYIGRWFLDSGITQLGDPSALGTGQNVNLASGATLTTTNLGAATYSYTPVSFTANGTGTGSGASTIQADASGIFDLGVHNITLNYTPTAFTGDATHPALYVSQGTLSLSGNGFTVNNNSGTPLGAGTYTLVQQAVGNITASGGFYAILGGSGLAPGLAAEIAITNGNVNLFVFPHTAANLVWQGGNPDNTWDKIITSNFKNGASFSTFNTSDGVTFNAAGIANNNVNLVGTLLPGSLSVDTSAGDYTFSGTGLIAGTTSLVKTGAGTLSLNNPNSYTGGTTISNGTIKLGEDDALANAGAGNVNLAVTNAVLDLNSWNPTINGLVGVGAVDNTAGGNSTLTLGLNNGTSVFNGIVRNSNGSVGITKIGTGSQTLASSNSYNGITAVNLGTLRVANSNGLGAGQSPLVVNAGVLDVGTNMFINNLTGGGGRIINGNTGTGTNILLMLNTSTYSGVIADGTTAKIGVLVAAGNLTLNGVGTYTGGTILQEGTTLSVGVINGTASGQPGTGGITASNNTIIAQPTGVTTSSAIPNTITTVPGATVNFTGGGSGANALNGLFVGAANTTNIFAGQLSFNGAGQQWSNFLGVAQFIPSITGAGNRIQNNANVLCGGDNTIFDIEGGFLFARNNPIISLGALIGGGIGGGITGPSTTSLPPLYVIGLKGIDTTYEGTISGSNSVAKSGVGKLTFDGVTVVTNTDESTYTNYIYSGSLITYLNNTTVSNGTLAVVVPNTLTNSTNISLAGTNATLDVSRMGYVSNFYDVDLTTVTNSILVTNGILETLTGQSFNGFGTLKGILIADAGSTLNPGNPSAVLTNGTVTGVMNITGSASIAGAINMRLNRTNAVNADRIAAASFAIDPAVTLLITNVGPALVAGDSFQLFNHPVTIAGTTLPTLAAPLYFTNKIAVDGSLAVASTVNTNRTNITSVYNTTSRVLTVSWPSDHLSWRLQAQTNAVGVGLTTNWVVVAGSSNVTTLNFTNTSTTGSTFYRLVYP